MVPITDDATTIFANALRAGETGSPGEGVGAGGMGVFGNVGVDVGQGVIMGRTVGVSVEKNIIDPLWGCRIAGPASCSRQPASAQWNVLRACATVRAGGLRRV